jgi:hypothetical protein
LKSTSRKEIYINSFILPGSLSWREIYLANHCYSRHSLLGSRHLSKDVIHDIIDNPPTQQREQKNPAIAINESSDICNLLSYPSHAQLFEEPTLFKQF